MNIQKRLQIEFEFVGEEQISGNTALKIVDDAFKDAQTNQRIIEELESLLMEIRDLGDVDNGFEGTFIDVEDVNDRIKELKQER
tara:strand:- start:850 stop:1101 length:252 start_codon:yes stop_codon:yes gene_type:complete